VFGEVFMPKSFPIFGSRNESILYDPDELIDLFLDCTADGFAILDRENRFIRINHMYKRIFGYTDEELIGKNFGDFPNIYLARDIIEQVKSGRAFSDLVTQRYHKDGRLLDIAVSYSPFRNVAGDIIGIIGIFRDITESVNLERDLRRTRELYKLITENTSDMIKIYSKDKKILYASPSHNNGVGIPPEQLVGKTVYDVIFPDEREDFERMFENLIETGEHQLYQVKLKTADSGVIYSETNISPVYNEQNEIDFYVTIGRNITDREKNDAALRNLDRLSIIGQLAAGVAHEIRNPLTSLKGFSKLLKGTTNREKMDEYLAIIMNELDRIDMIVNEFMSLAKPQAIQFERDNLISILDSTVNVLHPQALLHNVQVKINYPKEDIDLLCSPNQLKQVFVNFIKNAIEAMPNGGTVHVDVQKMENKKVIISFIDEGNGIDSELVKYLGTPFYTTKDKGIGLGLTVSNKIIQEHNGKMNIKSQIGIGTAIIVELQCL
jgi:two-component system, sporulation sensor kinase A